MRKIVILITMAMFAINMFAATTPKKPAPKAHEILIPIGATNHQISLLDLAYINAKDYEQVSGQKMKLAQRISFKLAQRDLKQSIAADGTINDKKMARSLAKISAGDTGFHIGGFALGLLAGLLGVVIAYVLNRDYKQNRIKWAWIGFGTFIVLYLLFNVVLL